MVQSYSTVLAPQLILSAMAADTITQRLAALPASQDEAVDGGKIAADILNRLPKEQRQKILARIEQIDRVAFSSLQEHLFTFEDLKSLTPNSLQRVVAEIPHRDLTLALKETSAELQQVVLDSLSARRQQALIDDLALLPAVSRQEAEGARQRILRIVDELRTQGKAVIAVDRERWA